MVPFNTLHHENTPLHTISHTTSTLIGHILTLSFVTYRTLWVKVLIKAIKLDCNLHINAPGFFTLFNLHKTLGSYKGTGSLIEHTFLCHFRQIYVVCSRRWTCSELFIGKFLFRGAFVVLLHSHRLCPTIVVNKENIRDLKLVEDKLVPFWPCCTYTFTIMSHLRTCWLSQRGRLSTEADKRSTNNGMIFTSISQSSSNKWVDRQHLPQRQQQI